MGEKSEFQGIINHYLMTVFYRLDKNPHGPSHRPIVVVCEQSDLSVLSILLDSNNQSINQHSSGNKQLGSVMIGMYIGKARFNLGNYEGNMTHEDVKNYLIKIVGKELELQGQPEKIGTIKQAYGHPKTGLQSKNSSFGCLPVIILFVSFGGLSIFGFNLL